MTRWWILVILVLFVLDVAFTGASAYRQFYPIQPTGLEKRVIGLERQWKQHQDADAIREHLLNKWMPPEIRSTVESYLGHKLDVK